MGTLCRPKLYTMEFSVVITTDIWSYQHLHFNILLY